MKSRRIDCLCIIVMIVAAMVCGCGSKPVVNNIAETAVLTESDDSQDSYLHITYDGKNYSYNSRIITVMYAGVDSEDDLKTYNRYSIAPRADAIELIIFDDYNKKISVLAVSRDTMTSVARYTMNGHYRDHYETHLGYAYTYGDGGQASCDNLREAVSDLLKGVPVHEYVVTNNSSIRELNALVGGLTVTVPNDDLEEKYPEMTKGASVTLSDDMAEAFVRWRDTNISYTNDGRMERQKAFSSSFFEKFITMVDKDVEGTWTKMTQYSRSYQTSITKSQYLDLAQRLKTEQFSTDQYYILSGEDQHDDEHDVDMFYVDEDQLMETIIKLFYIEEE